MVDITLSQATRDDRLNALRARIDAGLTNATLSLYAGKKPRTPDDDAPRALLLARLTFQKPCAERAALGVLDFAPLAEDPSAATAGRATWARIANGDGEAVLDCDVGGPNGGALITLNDQDIPAGGPVSIRSFKLTEPA